MSAGPRSPAKALPGYRGFRTLRRSPLVAQFAAFSEAAGREVVVHLAQAAGANAEQGLAAAKRLLTLSHPHLVKCTAADVAADGRAYVATEVPAGEPLTEAMARGAFDPEDVAGLATSLSGALDALHAIGIAHGDVGPWSVQVAKGETGPHAWLASPAVRLLTNAPTTSPEPPSPAGDVRDLAALVYACVNGTPFSRSPAEWPALRPAARHLTEVFARLQAPTPIGAGTFSSALQQANAAALAPNRTRVSRILARMPSNVGVKVVGDTLGTYRLDKVLGEGAMGHVFLASHVTLGRKVAIKVLRPELSGTPELIQRFFQEARSVNQINHEHIVEIFDFVEEAEAGGANTVYCVMEALDGVNLAALLERDPLPVSRCVDIVKQLCEALAAAHAVGVVHRDVKPDNIFITQRSGRDYVKVLDFGVAKLTSQSQPKVLETEDGAIFGTPTYMSPEQAEGRLVDHRSDIWAVGVLLYEALTGSVPFQAQSFAGLAARIIGQPPAPLPETTASGEPLTPALASVVLACLEKDPEQRPRSMTAVSTALTSATRAGAVEAPRAEAPPPRSRGPGVAVVVAVVGVLAVIGVGAAMRLSQDPPPPAAVVPPPTVVTTPVAAVEADDAGMAASDAGAPMLDGGPPVVDDDPADPPPTVAAKPKRQLTMADIAAGVSRAKTPLLKCFERHRAQLPGAEGKVTITLTIEPAGTVKTAAVSTPGLESGPLRDCIVGQAKRMRFPKHLGGLVTVNVPFAYRVE